MILCDFLFYNAVLHGAPWKNVAVLQRVQNNLVRVVLQKPKTVHVTPLLKSLHWLPIDAGIRYKLVLLTCKVKVSNTPDYLPTSAGCYQKLDHPCIDVATVVKKNIAASKVHEDELWRPCFQRFGARDLERSTCRLSFFSIWVFSKSD